jgi:hypothetical protein
MLITYLSNIRVSSNQHSAAGKPPAFKQGPSKSTLVISDNPFSDLS